MDFRVFRTEISDVVTAVGLGKSEGRWWVLLFGTDILC